MFEGLSSSKVIFKVNNLEKSIKCLDFLSLNCCFYLVESNGSHPNSEVKRLYAWSVLIAIELREGFRT